MTRYGITTFFSLLLFLVTTTSASGGTVLSLTADKASLLLKLSAKELKKARIGDLVGIKGKSKTMRSVAQIVKIVKNKANLKIKAGFRDWKKNDRVGLKFKRMDSPRKGLISSRKRNPANTRSNRPSMYSVSPEVGTTVFPVPTAGITAGYGLSHDLILEISGSVGEKSLGEERYEGDSYGISTNLSTSLISLRFKKLWTNNIYTNSGIGYRDIAYRGVISNYSPDNGMVLENHQNGDEIFSANRQDLVADISAGSRWHTGSFYFGVDLLGALIPIAQLSSGGYQENNVTLSSSNASADANTGNGDASSGETYEDYYEYDLPGISYQSKLYFGMSF